jgi:hypothetical protein
VGSARARAVVQWGVVPRPCRRALVAAAAAGALALAPAPAALADSIVATSGSELSVSSRAPAESGFGGQLSLVVEHFADADRNGVRVRELDRGLIEPSISSQDPDCTTNPIFNDVVCNGAPTRIVVSGSVGVDKVGIGGSNVGCEPGSPIETIVNLGDGEDVLLFFNCGSLTAPNRLSPRIDARGGFGDDILNGNVRNDVVSGESGNDLVFGRAGDDRVSGGGGNDELRGGDEFDTTPGSGNDVLDGDFGNDSLVGGDGDDQLSGGPGADVIDGGSGRDSATLRTDGTSNTVRLDGLANDGLAGEGDNYLSIEVLTGTLLRDVLVGSAAPERLAGGRGNDEITGGGGVDSLSGGDGDDLIDARDGIVDTVSCGSGQDQVVADLVDTVLVSGVLSPGQIRRAPECERVERFAADDGPPARAVGRRVRIARDGAVGVRVACPRTARVRCRGRLSLADPRRPGLVLAASAYEIRRGRSALIELELSASEATRLRARGAVAALTRERGASKKGPRSSLQVLVVR